MGQILRQNIGSTNNVVSPQPSCTQPFAPPTISLDFDFSESNETYFQHPNELDSLVEAESVKHFDPKL
jgi:hypothetical protein